MLLISNPGFNGGIQQTTNDKQQTGRSNSIDDYPLTTHKQKKYKDDFALSNDNYWDLSRFNLRRSCDGSRNTVLIRSTHGRSHHRSNQIGRGDVCRYHGNQSHIHQHIIKPRDAKKEWADNRDRRQIQRRRMRWLMVIGEKLCIGRRQSIAVIISGESRQCGFE